MRVRSTAGHFADDDEFDQLLPRSLQIRASLHFTPIAVARHAARLLSPCGGSLILDVGAGAGKFCLVAASEVPTTRFVGVEWRGHLVRIASRIADQMALDNVEFVHADAFDLDWSAYDAFYFFNPFAEQLYSDHFVLDHTIALDPRNFVTFIARVRARLACARVGTRLVTYHGFGGPPPYGFELVSAAALGSDTVELWIKVRAADDAARIG
jgi:SAM-dependent methyltransferase